MGYGNHSNMDSSQKPGGCKRFLQTILAGFLSLIWAGIGQAYNGQWGKGAALFVAEFALWFFWLGWIISIWAIIDAAVIRWQMTTPANQLRRNYEKW